MNREDIINSFDKRNILIVGDVILDHYLIGQVNRVSPEAPVPVVQHQKELFRLGGAANVALNIKALGGNAFLASTIGEDPFGRRLMELMQEENMSSQLVLPCQELQTICKTRVLARNQHLLRYDYEQIKNLPPHLEEVFLARITNFLDKQPIDAIVFQDYNKGVLTPKVITTIIALANQKNIPTLVDPKKDNFEQYKDVTLCKPNIREVNMVLGEVLDEFLLDENHLSKSAQTIQATLNNKITLITLGANGIFLQVGEQSTHFPTAQRQVADVCGAGDTVISVVALGLASNMPLNTVATLANIAGGQVCEQVGVVAVERSRMIDEYLRFIDKNI